VIVDEHPLQGAGGLLHNAGFELLIQLRHRAMLHRLAQLCERVQHDSENAEAAAAEADGTGHA
jgi:hypothetical protein